MTTKRTLCLFGTCCAQTFLLLGVHTVISDCKRTPTLSPTTSTANTVKGRHSTTQRDRTYIDNILYGREITNALHEDSEQRTTLEQLRKIYREKILPMQQKFHYESLPRHLMTESDIIAEPAILVLGPHGTGKTTMIHHLLNVERKLYKKKSTNGEFQIFTYGSPGRITDGTMLTTEHKRAFGWTEMFPYGFLEHLRLVELPNPLLKHVTIVDVPGVWESRKVADHGYSLDNVMEVLIQKADLILLVFDPSKLEVTKELETLYRRIREKENALHVILNKADTVDTEELMRTYGALMWLLSTLSNGTEHPKVSTGSFTSRAVSNANLEQLFQDEEVQVVETIRDIVANKVTNKISYVRHQAVQVKIHSIIVDSFVTAYRKRKRLFLADHELATHIVHSPDEYDVYKRAMSRGDLNAYDLPTHDEYVTYFSKNPLADQRRLSDLCYFLIGCSEEEKLNSAIDNDLPKLFNRHRRRAQNQPVDDAIFVYKVGKEKVKRNDEKEENQRSTGNILKTTLGDKGETAENRREKDSVRAVGRELKDDSQLSERLQIDKEKIDQKPKRQQEQRALAAKCPKYRKTCNLIATREPEIKNEIKCPKYRKRCNVENLKRAPQAVVTRVEKEKAKTCPKYRKECKERVTRPKQSVVAERRIDVEEKRCPRYRKTCNATKELTKTKLTVSSSGPEQPQPRCPKYRKSCARQGKMKKETMHQKDVGKKSCRKRATANEAREQDKVAGKMAAKPASCLPYRKSCNGSNASPQSRLTKVDVSAAQIKRTHEAKCPKYRKTCNVTEGLNFNSPALNQSRIVQVEPIFSAVQPCKKYRISCRKMLNEATAVS